MATYYRAVSAQERFLSQRNRFRRSCPRCSSTCRKDKVCTVRFGIALQSVLFCCKSGYQQSQYV
jgi:hypothetical protein